MNFAQLGFFLRIPAVEASGIPPESAARLAMELAVRCRACIGQLAAPMHITKPPQFSPEGEMYFKTARTRGSLLASFFPPTSILETPKSYTRFSQRSTSSLATYTATSSVCA